MDALPDPLKEFPLRTPITLRIATNAAGIRIYSFSLQSTGQRLYGGPLPPEQLKSHISAEAETPPVSPDPVEPNTKDSEPEIVNPKPVVDPDVVSPSSTEPATEPETIPEPTFPDPNPGA